MIRQFALLIALAGLFTLTSCDDGPLENAGESIEDAADDAGDALENAADEVEDAADGH